MRREEEYVGKRVMGMEVSGKRRRGRPKRRWLDSIRNDLSERELSGEEARKTKFNEGISLETSAPHKSGKRCGRRRLAYYYIAGSKTGFDERNPEVPILQRHGP